MSSPLAADAVAVRSRVDRLLAKPLTADAAVQVALLNNRGLQAQYNELGVSEAEYVEASLPPSPTVSIERVSGYEPGRRLAYDLVWGLPVRDYHAEVTLQPTAGGTEIAWHSTFRAKIPGTGWLWRLGLRRFIADVADRLARHAAGSVAERTA